jgi:peptide/nickel transport system substrate-binding protein
MAWTTICKALRRLLLAPAVATGVGLVPARAADLRIGTSATTSAMDPHFHLLAFNMSVMAHLFQTLVAQDADQKLTPGLATAWRLVDDTTWEFDLRRDVRFHDGSSFTADDVLFSLKRMPLVPNSPSSFALYLRGIAAVEKVDDYRVRFRTKGPYADVPVDMSMISIVSHTAAAGAALEGKTTEQMNRGEGTVGTGPYRFVSFAPGDRVGLARNDTYWGPREPWDRVSIIAVPSAASRVAALLSGGLDVIEKVQGEDVAVLRADQRVQVVVAPSNSVNYIVIDQYRDNSPGVSGTPNGKNPLRDARVRHALSLAMNREALTERIMSGLATPAAELAAPTMFGANPDAKVDPFDPEAAKRLLAEAGFGGGFNLVLVTTNGFYVQDAAMAQAIAASWTRIGVRTQVEAVPSSVFYARRGKNELSIYYTSSSITTGQASDMLKILVATRDVAKGLGQINFGGYSNPETDDLIDRSAHTLDNATRQDMLRQASRIAIARDAAVLPVFVEKLAYGMRRPLLYTPRVDKWITAMQVRAP